MPSAVDCLLGNLNKSINLEMGIQLILPELYGGEKAGLSLILHRMCTAQGCQARGTEIQPEDLGTGLNPPMEKLRFMHTRCHLLTEYCGPPATGLLLPRGSDTFQFAKS